MAARGSRGGSLEPSKSLPPCAPVLYFLARVTDPVGAAYGDVAQLGEHGLCKPEVEGSSPFVSTKETCRPADCSAGLLPSA